MDFPLYINHPFWGTPFMETSTSGSKSFGLPGTTRGIMLVQPEGDGVSKDWLTKTMLWYQQIQQGQAKLQ